MLDQLERHRIVQRRILGQIDVGHAAAPQLAYDLVLADPPAGARNHCLPPSGRACVAAPVRGARTGLGASRSKFISFAPSAPPGTSNTLRSTTLPNSPGRAPSRSAIPAPLLP